MRILLYMASVVVLSACSAIPEKLQLAENTNIIVFSDIKNNAEASVGQATRWGGIIAKVENQAKRTMIEVVSFELGNSAKPKQKNETAGRFRLYFSGLLDPVIYKKGKSITAVGTISVFEDGKIGEHEYQFPVLQATNVHLWKDIQQVDVNFISPPLWYYPRYNSFPINRHVRTSNGRTYKQVGSQPKSNSSTQANTPKRSESSPSRTR